MRRKIKITRTYRNDDRSVACIKIQGRWLEKLGFEQGKFIEVKEEQGKLIIKLAEEQS